MLATFVGKCKKIVFQLDIIHEYNHYTGGIHLVDQVRQVCPSLHKTIKWYKKLFLHMIDITIYDCLIIWKALNLEGRGPYLNFRLRIAHSLIEEYHVQCPLHSEGKK
jgi:hypothetical protein